MKKYKALTPFFKLSEQKNYAKGDIIELEDNDANRLIESGHVAKYNLEPYSESDEGTKGISTKLTPEQADKQIKALNKKKK